MKKLTFVVALLGAALVPAPRAARAQSALSQLAVSAGADAAPVVRTLKKARALAAAPRPAASRVHELRDPFACSAITGPAPMHWNAKQAAILVQTCLNHDYRADGPYTVRARARANEGLDILIFGVVPDGDEVREELAEALQARHGMLLGFRAILNDLTSGR